MFKARLGQSQLMRDDFVFRFVGHHGLPRGLRAMAFDQSQGLLAVGCDDGAVKVFGRGGVSVLLRGPAEGIDAVSVTCLAFSPCTGNLVTVSADSSVDVWDLGRHALVGTLPSSWTSAVITTVHFCPGGKFDFALLGDADGTIHVLDLLLLQVSGYRVFPADTGSKVSMS